MNAIAQMTERLTTYTPKTIEDALPEAGILVPVTRNPSNPEIILTRRAQHMSTHQGQVAFPGGKFDLEDGSVAQTALRECHEEVGIAPEEVELIAPLSQVISLHGIRVSPYVGLVDEDVEVTPNLDELDSIFRVSVNDILEMEPTRRDRTTFKGMALSIPSYDYTYQGETYEIWGLSAIVMVELLNVAFDAKITIFEDYERTRR